MKKIIFSLALAAFMATGASAQENRVKISANVGAQWNSETGVVAGVDALIPFGESRWGFEPGIYYSFRNATSDHSENNVKEECNDKLHYINVPLRLAVRVAGQEDGPFNLSSSSVLIWLTELTERAIIPLRKTTRPPRLRQTHSVTKVA